MSEGSGGEDLKDLYDYGGDPELEGKEVKGEEDEEEMGGEEEEEGGEEE